MLKQTSRIRKKNVSTLVVACSILHNILNFIGVEIPEIEGGPEDESRDSEHVEWDGEVESDSVRDILVALA